MTTQQKWNKQLPRKEYEKFSLSFDRKLYRQLAAYALARGINRCQAVRILVQLALASIIDKKGV